MNAEIPASVRRVEGSRVWHFPRLLEDGGVPGKVWCGASGKLTGLAVGTEGLELCEACVEAARAFAKK